MCFCAFERKLHELDPGVLTSSEPWQLGKVKKLLCACSLNTTTTKSCKAILLPDPSPCSLSLNLTDPRGKGTPRDLDREKWRDRVEEGVIIHTNTAQEGSDTPRKHCSECETVRHLCWYLEREKKVYKCSRSDQVYRLQTGKKKLIIIIYF